MSKLDILVLSGIVIAVCYPAILSALNVAGNLTTFFAKPSATQEQWRQRWTATLIELLGDLDKQGMKQGATLCRELMWEILGGDQGGKK